jgi:NAD(P)-dependent dehydrogenase (short-subunit alcohol dehydrogenase family)
LLLAEGAQVTVCGRDLGRLEAAQRALGDGALCVATDVTNETQLDELVSRATAKFGRLDGVVNNAGHASGGPVAGSTNEAWRSDYDLKVIAAVQLARRATPALVATGGSILNVLSIKAKAPDANSTPTSASRAAGLALTKALAGELGPQNVRVNAILIGLIESGQWVRMAQKAQTEVADLYATITSSQSIPLGRFGRASEFAALAAFVLSPRASYLTGTAINLDGGLSPAS